MGQCVVGVLYYDERLNAHLSRQTERKEEKEKKKLALVPVQITLTTEADDKKKYIEFCLRQCSYIIYSAFLSIFNFYFSN